ncbi:MAG: hypothetical protein ISR64_10540 [Deltaproteobacteria bacterium]|nr:hypothetical protein [Deltaproteobacteria bacterium]
MKRVFLTTVLAVAFLSSPLRAGQWDLQYSTAESDTAILSVAAPTESKVIGFGVEQDGQGGSRSVWFKSADGLQWAMPDVPMGGDQAMSGDASVGPESGGTNGGSSCTVGESGAGAIPVLLLTIALLCWLGRRAPRET